MCVVEIGQPKNKIYICTLNQNSYVQLICREFIEIFLYIGNPCIKIFNFPKVDKLNFMVVWNTLGIPSKRW